MSVLVFGLAVFLVVHSYTMRREARAVAIEMIGEGGYRIAYSIGSLVGLGMIVVGFGMYRANDWIDVWYPPVFTRHLALVLTLPVFVLLAAAYLPGRIKAVAKHPMLLAVKIWAFAHLLANGDLGSMLLFGSFLIWAVIARIAAKRREETLPFAPAGSSATFGRNDAIAVAAGLALWAAFVFWLHPLLIGVAVWPS